MPTGIYIRDPEVQTRRLETVHKLRIEHGNFRGKGHPNWKGDEVSYSGVHKWIYRQMGKAKVCSSKDDTCSTRFEWSNISGEYKRDLKDYEQLCASHHRRKDGNNFPWNKIKE